MYGRLVSWSGKSSHWVKLCPDTIIIITIIIIVIIVIIIIIILIIILMIKDHASRRQ